MVTGPKATTTRNPHHILKASVMHHSVNWIKRDVGFFYENEIYQKMKNHANKVY